MQRRTFIASAVAPLANHVSRTLHTRRPGIRPSPVRRQCAVLLLVIPPGNWRPKNWRDIPPAMNARPTVIVDRYRPQAVGIVRAAAKIHNQLAMSSGMSTWAVVAMTDGRLHRAESEVRS